MEMKRKAAVALLISDKTEFQNRSIYNTKGLIK